MLVKLGSHRFRCRVARTPGAHARGLQGYAPLASDEAMLFMFDQPRAATFHMGRVAFPIDIVFTHAGKVTKVVHNVQPGDRGRWSAVPVDAVLELPGDTCRRLGIAPPLPTSHYTVDIPHEVTERPPDNRPPDERYRHVGPPDEASPNADEMSTPSYKHNMGYDPSEYPDGDGPALRPAAARISAPEDFAVTLLEAMAREPRPLDWRREPLNPELSYATVTGATIRQWLGNLGGLGASELTDVYDAATSHDGLRVLGDALIATGVAIESKITEHPNDDEGAPVLVLWRYHG